MLKILDGASDKAIAVEIIDGYMPEDEKTIEKLFDEKVAAGHNQVNLLVKVDNLSFSKSSWKAMWNDSVYAIKHMKHCGRIAIVGHSKVEEFLVKSDNAFFENKKKDRAEKYFDVADIDNATGWVNE